MAVAGGVRDGGPPGVLQKCRVRWKTSTTKRFSHSSGLLVQFVLSSVGITYCPLLISEVKMFPFARSSLGLRICYKTHYFFPLYHPKQVITVSQFHILQVIRRLN